MELNYYVTTQIQIPAEKKQILQFQRTFLNTLNISIHGHNLSFNSEHKFIFYVEIYEGIAKVKAIIERNDDTSEKLFWE